MDAHPLQLRPGRHNMASEAFAALKEARKADKPAGEKLHFSDLVDVLNPLQHLPLIGPAYRALTGDELSPASRIIGGLIYGGPIGMAVSLADSIVEAETGRDMGGTVIAGIFGGEQEAPRQIAEAQKPASPASNENAAQQIGEPEISIPAAGPLLLSPVIASEPVINSGTAAPPIAARKEMVDKDVTASIGLPAKPASGVAGPLPQMSAETFNALVNSFAAPAHIKTAVADPEPAQASQALPDVFAAKDISLEMQRALDKLAALKKSRTSLN